MRLGALLTTLAVGCLSISNVYAGCATGNCGGGGGGGYGSGGYSSTQSYGGKAGTSACDSTYGMNPYPYNKGVDERAYSPEINTLPAPNLGNPSCYSPGYAPCLDVYSSRWLRNVSIDVQRDFVCYFQTCNLLTLATFFAGAAISANTGLDRTISMHWQEDIRSSTSNSFFKPFNSIGGLSYYYFPLYLAAVGFGAWQECTLTGNVLYHWGYRSLRTIILTTVQQIPLTYIIGSGRPNQNQPSKWQPFKYKTGVSGHTIFGAIPFLTAAMMTDPPLFRYGLYVLSALPGLARINNNTHYFSQVLLGWGIAYLSASAVYRSDQARQSGMQISLVPKYDGAMLLARIEF